MTSQDVPAQVTIRRYPDSPICDVVVVVRGQEMVIRCPSYSHGLKWARLERKSYKIPEPITDFPDDEEPGDVPLFCAQIEIETAPDLPDDYNRQLPTAYRLTAHRQGFAKIYVERGFNGVGASHPKFAHYRLTLP